MNTVKELVVRMVHFGPITTMMLVKTITLSTIYCSLMWWPPAESIGGLLFLTSFLCSSGLVMYNFFSAMTIGPGYLPLGWQPEDNKSEAKDKLQFCSSCKGFKAPRAHHCRKCGRCVMKMDHHCPWINNCVGHRNHTHFILFLIFAVLGCAHGAVILSCSLYRAIYRNYYAYYRIDVPNVHLGIYGLIWVLFSIGCAFGVVVGVGVLLYYQVKAVVKNKTGVEEWIVEKAEYRRCRRPDLGEFIYPYDLGWRQNCRQVMNPACEPVGNGIDWPVQEGCDQYTLTVEQIHQKDDKRRRAKEYTIVENYSGSWCPISKGFCVFLRPPFSDESRIKLSKDDRIIVTRWKKYWLYGVVVEGKSSANENPRDAPPARKGWFPRRCAVEVIDTVEDSSDEESFQHVQAPDQEDQEDIEKKDK